MNIDYLIVGGGISGVTLARLLQQRGVEKVLVLEKEHKLGGLCRTEVVRNHVLDIGGGHFLCTRFPEVYDFIFSHISKSEFNYFNRVSKIQLGNFQTDYPLESNIWQFPPESCAEYLVSIVQNGEARGVQAPKDFENWIRWKLGDRVADEYMLPYNRKIWGVAPHRMDIDWLYKIPTIDIREIVLSCLRREMDRAKMPSHSGFYYPKKGGFQRIFDAIAEPIQSMVEKGVEVNKIEKISGGLLVNGRYRAKRVINTAPWSFIADSPIFDSDTRRAISALENNSLVVSLYEESYTTDAHWCYIPSEKEKHHRDFYIHNFAPYSSEKGLYRETNLNRWSANGEIYHHINRHAYPIPVRGWRKAIDCVLACAEQHEVYGLGRWGQWQYFNADVCIREAMQLCKKFTVEKCSL